MKSQEDMEALLKKELEEVVVGSEFYEFPEKLEPKEPNVPNLDRWREK